MKHNQYGHLYLNFKEVQGTKAMRAEKGTSMLGAMRALSYVSCRTEEFDRVKVLPKTDSKLGYKGHDILHSLPGLAVTALQGRAFCKALREDLIYATVLNEGSGAAG